MLLSIHPRINCYRMVQLRAIDSYQEHLKEIALLIKSDFKEPKTLKIGNLITRQIPLKKRQNFKSIQ